MKRGLADYLESLAGAGVTDLPSVDSFEPLFLNVNDVTEEHPVQEQDIDRQAVLNVIAAEVCKCLKCKELASTRTQTVFGNGNPNSPLVFLGEAPGADEDRDGVPFVGRAGRLLDDIITKGMGLTRESVYVCNILRCRPPGNRNPLPDEAANCRPFLDRTLDVIKPRFICCLGAVAAQNLLQTTDSIGSMRGKILDYRGIKVICTYHPAYLLRSPNMKVKTWEDIQLLLREMGLPIPRKKSEM